MLLLLFGAVRPRAASARKLSLLLLLVAANQRMEQLVERELVRDGVDPHGYALLSLIGARGTPRLTELAQELGMPLTTVSDAVRRLEARTLVRRRPNPEDGRSSLFELTPHGNREWRAGWAALRRISEALKLEVDEQEMRDALTRLGNAFENIIAAGPTPDPMASN